MYLHKLTVPGRSSFALLFPKAWSEGNPYFPLCSAIPLKKLEKVLVLNNPHVTVDIPTFRLNLHPQYTKTQMFHFHAWIPPNFAQAAFNNSKIRTKLYFQSWQELNCFGEWAEQAPAPSETCWWCSPWLEMQKDDVPRWCSMATCTRNLWNNPGTKHCTALGLSFAICEMVASTCCVKYLEISSGEIYIYMYVKLKIMYHYYPSGLQKFRPTAYTYIFPPNIRLDSETVLSGDWIFFW